MEGQKEIKQGMPLAKRGVIEGKRQAKEGHRGIRSDLLKRKPAGWGKKKRASEAREGVLGAKIRGKKRGGWSLRGAQ